MKKKKQSILKVLFGYAGSYKYLTISSWILSAISALIALVPFVYIWKIIKEVLDVMPHFTEAHSIVHNGWMAVVFSCLSIVIYIAALLCSHKAAFHIAANIRKRTLHHIITLPLGFMDNFGSGKLRKIVNESSAATETYLAHQLPDKVGSLATPIGLLFLLLWFDWRMGLLCLVPVALAFLIMYIFMTGPNLKRGMTLYQQALDGMTNEAVEYVRGIPVVKTFGQSVFSFRKFKKTIDDYGTFVIGYTKSLRLPMVFYTTIINAIFAVLIGMTLLTVNGRPSNEFLLNLLYYIIITPIITVTLTRIMYASEEEMIVGEAINRIHSVINIKPLPESDEAKIPKDNSIELNNVIFRYEEAASDAINNISLSIKPGEHVAFVGPSGGGKTTLASLLARFWDVKSGEILIGGIDVRKIKKDQLTRTISFVFQDSRLIKGTIYDNVRMARPDASKGEVMKALHDAQCDDILDKMPNGANTYIGTGGIYLSGGEQQRLSIARVMLRNTPILILDEATAFADPENEAKVQQAFVSLAKGKTLIMIAHRLSTITSADKIYVLKDGAITECGTHQELVREKSLYARMWKEYCNNAEFKITKKEDNNNEKNK
jgi:ATP-binding cassette subfamily B protein